MEYMTCLSIPAPDAELYGRPVRDMVHKGARIQANGIVKGRFPYVTDYITINGKTKGHYFPAWVNVEGKEVEIVRCADGTSGKGPWGERGKDNFVVILMDDNKEFDIKVDGKVICHLDFSEAILEEKKGEGKMYTKLFDEGTCGIAQYAIIGVLDKSTKANETVTFKNAIPKGFRLVHGFTNPSADLTGGGTIDVGYPGSESYYVSAMTLDTYKGKGCGGEYPYNLREVPSADVTAKISEAITAGKVELAVEIVKLEA